MNSRQGRNLKRELSKRRKMQRSSNRNWKSLVWSKRRNESSLINLNEMNLQLERKKRRLNKLHNQKRFLLNQNILKVCQHQRKSLRWVIWINLELKFIELRFERSTRVIKHLTLTISINLKRRLFNKFHKILKLELNRSSFIHDLTDLWTNLKFIKKKNFKLLLIHKFIHMLKQNSLSNELSLNKNSIESGLLNRSKLLKSSKCHELQRLHHTWDLSLTFNDRKDRSNRLNKSKLRLSIRTELLQMGIQFLLSIINILVILTVSMKFQRNQLFKIFTHIPLMKPQ